MKSNSFMTDCHRGTDKFATEAQTSLPQRHREKIQQINQNQKLRAVSCLRFFFASLRLCDLA
jgi:hypothetical protein